MMDLQEIREKLDALDSQIIPLLQARMDCSLEVAQYKKAHNLPILDASREEVILKKVLEKSKPLYGNAMVQLYKAIMEQSRELQKQQIERQ